MIIDMTPGDYISREVTTLALTTYRECVNYSEEEETNYYGVELRDNAISELPYHNLPKHGRLLDHECWDALYKQIDAIFDNCLSQIYSIINDENDIARDNDYFAIIEGHNANFIVGVVKENVIVCTLEITEIDRHIEFYNRQVLYDIKGEYFDYKSIIPIYERQYEELLSPFKDEIHRIYTIATTIFNLLN